MLDFRERPLANGHPSPNYFSYDHIKLFSRLSTQLNEDPESTTYRAMRTAIFNQLDDMQANHSPFLVADGYEPPAVTIPGRISEVTTLSDNERWFLGIMNRAGNANVEAWLHSLAMHERVPSPADALNNLRREAASLLERFVDVTDALMEARCWRIRSFEDGSHVARWYCVGYVIFQRRRDALRGYLLALEDGLNVQEPLQNGNGIQGPFPEPPPPEWDREPYVGTDDAGQCVCPPPTPKPDFWEMRTFVRNAREILNEREEQQQCPNTVFPDEQLADPPGCLLTLYDGKYLLP
ncbi:MAG: hypothetical protein M1837_000869 [Sclerophora amabilis]|nr:MAG: hypothetical protein M1837_000869 [Sclerophora amabilis]